MARSNFKVFAESVANKNIQSDAVYNVDTQRISGVVPGVAEPKMHNKLYKQATIMTAAIAQVIVQAGFDALDSDYSGLVSNLRKSFVGSVNGVKPDELGNIDLTEIIEEIRNMTYPRIGDFIITRNPDNPSKRYKNTTWVLLEEKTFIMSAGSGVPVGSTGGSNTHENTIEEMPKHNHVGSTTHAGGHSHTRGDMNITGDFSGVGEYYDNVSNTVSGAFYRKNTADNPVQGARVSNDGQRDDWFGFDASQSWSGATSEEPNHNHEVSIEDTGNGKSWDIRPRYIAAYIWIRTK